MRMRDVTEHLIGDPHAADKLKLVDAYIVQLHKVGKQFVLPHEHKELKPLVEAYANDLPKFTEYIRAIRDAVPARSESYISLHELYRTINVRKVQQERRARFGRAMEWLEKKYPKLNYEQKTRWLRKLEQQWGRERLEYMETFRKRLTKQRLSTEEREEVLLKFWQEVDESINQGTLPPP